MVTNTETVQAYLNASGAVEVARVYEQLAMKGKGSVRSSNPVATRDLRNLDGFGGFEVRNGDSSALRGRRRAAGAHGQRLRQGPAAEGARDATRWTAGRCSPATSSAATASRGCSYTVQNVTGKPQDVSFDDGTGTKVTSSQDVVIPMVGSLTTTLPSELHRREVRRGEHGR